MAHPRPALSIAEGIASRRTFVQLDRSSRLTGYSLTGLDPAFYAGQRVVRLRSEKLASFLIAANTPGTEIREW
jgi:hypothetical protein